MATSFIGALPLQAKPAYVRRTCPVTLPCGDFAMLARRNTFLKYDNDSDNQDFGSSAPPPPSPEVSEKFKETAKAFGIDTSGQVRREEKEESVETTFYKMTVKNLGQDAINIIEGFLVVTALGSLSFILAVGTAIAFLAYYKATGKPVPEQLDAFCAAGEPAFSPLMGLFLTCTTTYGLWKFAEYDAKEAERGEGGKL